MKKLDHLAEICSSYDTFVIDLWGVMHNGISLNHKAIETVDNLIKKSKKVVFLSNAPRPSEKVRDFLRRLQMEERYLKNIITSGEAAKQAIDKNQFGKLFYHLGPSKDDSIFSKVKHNKTNLEKCDYILCTGLFNDKEDDINFYENLLKDFVNKKLICTNPDLIVHVGKREEYCAGYIAQIFESLGGSVVYYGKPHKEIYNMCFDKKEKVLAIGDNLRTDIKGANNSKIDSIFISNGVHKNEFKNQNELNQLLIKHRVETNFFQTDLTW